MKSLKDLASRVRDILFGAKQFVQKYPSPASYVGAKVPQVKQVTQGAKRFVSEPLRYMYKDVYQHPKVSPTLKQFGRGTWEGAAAFLPPKTAYPMQVPEPTTTREKVARFAGGLTGFVAGPGKLYSLVEAPIATKLGLQTAKWPWLARKAIPAIGAEAFSAGIAAPIRAKWRGEPLKKAYKEEVSAGLTGRAIFGGGLGALGLVAGLARGAKGIPIGNEKILKRAYELFEHDLKASELIGDIQAKISTKQVKSFAGQLATDSPKYADQYLNRAIKIAHFINSVEKGVIVNQPLVGFGTVKISEAPKVKIKGIPLEPLAQEARKSEDAIEFVEKRLKRELYYPTDKDLYGLQSREGSNIGVWKRALEKKGLTPEKVKYYQGEIKKSEDTVKTIKALRSAGFNTYSDFYTQATKGVKPVAPTGVGEMREIDLSKAKPTKVEGFAQYKEIGKPLYEIDSQISLDDIGKRSITTPEYRDYDLSLKAGKKVTKPIVATVRDITDPNSSIEIVDGWHRWRQAVLNQDKTVPIKYIFEKPVAQPPIGEAKVKIKAPEALQTEKIKIKQTAPVKIQDVTEPTLQKQALQEPKTPLQKAEKARTKVKEGQLADSFGDSINKSEIDVKDKVNLLDYLRTPDRVLKKIGMEKEATLLRTKYEAYVKQVPQEIDKITAWSKQVPKESNQKIFKYLDGQDIKLNKTELKVAGEVQTYLADWAEKLDLPKDKRIASYITHIFEKDLIKKEFDPEFAKLIQDKVAGSVYDPFLEKRLGKMGYVEDTWRALDAYVKRATRKFHMDQALGQVKAKAKGLELSQYKYVKQYIDRINLRPTDIDNLMDNQIKQIVGYKYGQRPTTLLTRSGRQWVYRGTLGLNPATAIKNLTQGANTYAKLGERDTIGGYLKLLTNGTDELYEHGVLRDQFIQDRTINATRKFWEKFDKGLFVFFDLGEKINRGAAYYGAKSQALRKGLSEAQAIEFGKKMVRDTQFTFGSIDTPPILSSDLSKLLLQFQSFTIKQGEFLLEMVDNKEFVGLARYVLASLVMAGTIGELIGMEWKDFIPSFRVGLPPTLKAPVEIGKAILGVPDKYGNVPNLTERIENIGKAFIPFIPAGTQMKKTIEGLGVVEKGYSESKAGRIRTPVEQSLENRLRGGLFGQYNLPELRRYFDEEMNVLGEKQSLRFKEMTPEERREYFESIQEKRKKKKKSSLLDVTQAAEGGLLNRFTSWFAKPTPEAVEEVKTTPLPTSTEELKVLYKDSSSVLNNYEANKTRIKYGDYESEFDRKEALNKLENKYKFSKDIFDRIVREYPEFEAELPLELPTEVEPLSAIYKSNLSTIRGYEDKKTKIQHGDYTKLEKEEKLLKLKKDYDYAIKQREQIETERPEQVFEVQLDTYKSGGGAKVEDRGDWVAEQLKKQPVKITDGIDPLIKKYFPQEQWANAQAVMMGESGGRADAVGDNYTINGVYAPSYGKFQIRALPGRPSPQQLKDPDFNVRYAAQMWRQQGWGPWTVARNLGIVGGGTVSDYPKYTGETQEMINQMWESGVLTTGKRGTAEYIKEKYGIDVYSYTGSDQDIAEKVAKASKVKVKKVAKVTVKKLAPSKITFKALGRKALPAIKLKAPPKFKVSEAKPVKITVPKELPAIKMPPASAFRLTVSR